MSAGVADEVAVSDVPALIASGALLLDVREADEWEAGHAPDATHIPMSELGQRLPELPHDRPILAVCHVGARSAWVTDALSGRGYDIRNVSGGMSAWARAGLPVVDATGNSGRID